MLLLPTATQRCKRTFPDRREGARIPSVKEIIALIGAIRQYVSMDRGSLTVEWVLVIDKTSMMLDPFFKSHYVCILLYVLVVSYVLSSI